MAVAVSKAARVKSDGLRMNSVFGAMGVVMLAVMGVSMWKDTHPQWRAYQQQFAVIERKVLLQQQADLKRQLEHPDYDGDYLKAKKEYEAVKGTYDTASSALDDTEASLEELELQVKGGDTEGESAESSETAAAKPAAATATGPASKDELADLDKEFKESGGSNGSGSAPAAEKPAKGATPKAAPAKAAPSKDEMSDLDKEFQSADAPKGGQSDEAGGPATKAPAKGAAKPEAKAPSKGASSEEAELDKEFQSTDAPKGEQPAPAGGQKAGNAPAAPQSGQAAAAPAEELTYEEASFVPDQQAAEAKTDAAQRGLIIEQQKHAKEMIGLPEGETAKRNLADARLKEAEQTVALAQASIVLEQQKAKVKTAAQVAKWAHDVAELNKGGASPDRLPALQESKKNLDAHIDGLKRDLRLVEGRLERNAKLAPEIQQTYIESLGTVDRCATCHRATDDPAFASAPQPFQTHPGNMLKWHPIERFGCATCHGGWGNALDKGEAHGELMGKGSPLLAGDAVQSSCGKCHGDTKPLPGNAMYLEGAQLFRTSGCLGCHKVESIPAVNKQGPGLDRVDEKVNAAWLVQWLKNPRSHSPDARMPSFGFTEGEAQAITAYLLDQHGKQPVVAPSSLVEVSADRLTAGRRLVEGLGCMGCHMIKGEGNAVGPELTNIRYKANPQWLYSWIENPKAYLPNSRMPVFGLTHDQSVLIGDYLLSVGKDQPMPAPVAASVLTSSAATTGSKLIAERGCAGCHDIKGFDRIAAPELTHEGDKTGDLLEFGNARKVKHTLYDYIAAKLKDPDTYDTDKFKAKMPKFGLDEQESRAMAIYILSLTSQTLPPEYTKDVRDQDSPIVAGRRVFAEHSCSSCHRIAGQGGKVGPELTREGEKVQPIWLFGFLENPSRIRWWQDARMPNFHLTQGEATTLTEYLMELSNQPAPYQYLPPEQMVFPRAAEGLKHFTDLKCQSCHPLGGKQAVSGGDTKKLGPDLALAPKRLKADWMLRFLKDPQGFDPGTQMPTFKQSDETFQSIIDFLMKPQ